MRKVEAPTLTSCGSRLSTLPTMTASALATRAGPGGGVGMVPACGLKVQTPATMAARKRFERFMVKLLEVNQEGIVLKTNGRRRWFCQATKPRSGDSQ